MSSVDTVIFDVGNVLVHWNPRFLYEKLITDKQELEYFLSEVITMQWHTEHDRGRSFEEGVAILSKQFPEYGDWIGAYNDRWDETIGGPIVGSVQILDHLKNSDVPVYGLTNFNEPKWNEFKKKYKFISMLDDVVVSGREKMVKPDPRLFQLTLDRFDLEPSTTLFIDDNVMNVQAASKLGMKTHQFISPTALARDMRQYGLVD